MTQTLVKRLAQVAQSSPDSRFCTFLAGDRIETISFGQLYERSCAYAHHYTQQGIAAGDVVVVILQHTPHLFYSYVGAILAGAIPTFMPFPSPKQRLDLYWHDHELLFARIKPRLMVTYERNLESANAAIPDFAVPSLIAADSIFQTLPESLKPIEVDPDSIACLQHSSGTTGLKKGVMLTHRAVLDEIDTYSAAIGLSQGDGIASWLPLYHDMGFIACFMTSVVLGTHLIAIDPFEWVMRPTLLLDAIQDYRASFTWLPNFAFSHIVNGARKSKTWDLSSVRAFINCSEPCKAATFDRFFERFRDCGVTREKLQVCYAMAENVFAVTQTPMNETVNVALDPEKGQAIVSCGPPIGGVEIEISPLGGIGEIRLRSPFMFDGYYRLPEKTAERLREGWYHTGDMGFVSDGELYVTGRMDDMLIVNGRNYYAHEIESIVNDIPGTFPGRNVAISVDDALTDSTVVIVLAECRPEVDGPEVGLEVRKRLLEALGLAIHSVVTLAPGQMVKTTSGKISRGKNKELYLSGALLGRGGVSG